MARIYTDIFHKIQNVTKFRFMNRFRRKLYGRKGHVFFFFKEIIPHYTPEKLPIFGDFLYDSYNRYLYDSFWA